MKIGRKKEGKEKNVEYRVFVDLSERLYIAVEDGDKYRFAYWDENEESVELTDSVVVEEKEIRPMSPYMGEGKKKIPLGYPTVEIVNVEVPTTNELMAKIDKFMYKYIDAYPEDRKLMTFFALSTWFQRKVDTVAYLRFLGDSGRGKSRMLTVVGDLSFFPLMLSGNATRSAIMRIQEKVNGTLVIDEADFIGDKANELIKYLNAGFEKRKVAIMTNKTDPSKVEVFDPFSAKIFAMREPFRDSAVEGRLISIEPYETKRKDIPPVLPREYYDEVLHLRNIIAAWALKNWTKVSGEAHRIVQELPVEPRLKQLATPLSIILPLFEDKMNNMFVNWLLQRQKKIAEQRAVSVEGTIFNTIVDIAKRLIEPKDLPSKFDKYVVAEGLTEESEYIGAITVSMLSELTGISSRRISGVLQEIGFYLERRVREIGDKKIRGRLVCVESTQRWFENWKRYRIGEPIMDVPDMVKGIGRSYEPVIEVLEPPTKIEIGILSKELQGDKNVKCKVVVKFSQFSKVLSKDVLLLPGIILTCDENFARYLSDAGLVEFEGDENDSPEKGQDTVFRGV